MNEDRTTTEHDAGGYERAHSDEYEVSMFDPEGMFDPAPDWDESRLTRFLAEDAAIRQSEWYNKNITSVS